MHLSLNRVVKLIHTMTPAKSAAIVIYFECHHLLRPEMLASRSKSKVDTLGVQCGPAVTHAAKTRVATISCLFSPSFLPLWRFRLWRIAALSSVDQPLPVTTRFPPRQLPLFVSNRQTTPADSALRRRNTGIRKTLALSMDETGNGVGRKPHEKWHVLSQILVAIGVIV